MSSSAIQEIVARLERQQVALKRLRGLYQDLKKLLIQKIGDTKVELPELAKLWSTRPSRIQEFLDGNRVICKGKLFDSLMGFVEDPEMAQSIQENCHQMPERLIAMAVASDETIELYFILHLACVKAGSELNIERFSSLFGDYNDLVAGVMHSDKAAMQSVEIPDEESGSTPLQAILDIVTSSELEERLSTYLSAHRARRDELGKLIEEGIKPLRDQFEQFKDLAKALGVSETSLRDAMSGSDRTTTERQEEILEKLEAYEKTANKVDEKTKAHKPMTPLPIVGTRFDQLPEFDESRVSEPEPLVRRDLHDVEVDASAAGTEVDGVSYVLTPETFRPLRLRLVSDILPSAKGFLQGARATLNLLMQASDPRLKESIRRDLLKEVEETQLAIEAFLSANPSALTELNKERRGILRGTTTAR